MYRSTLTHHSKKIKLKIHYQSQIRLSTLTSYIESTAPTGPPDGVTVQAIGSQALKVLWEVMPLLLWVTAAAAAANDVPSADNIVK